MKRTRFGPIVLNGVRIIVSGHSWAVSKKFKVHAIIDNGLLQPVTTYLHRGRLSRIDVTLKCLNNLSVVGINSQVQPIVNCNSSGSPVMSFRQPREPALQPSSLHRPTYSQRFSNQNNPATLHQPTQSAWTSTSTSLPVSEYKVVLTTAHHYNISDWWREQGPHKRLHRAPIQ